MNYPTQGYAAAGWNGPGSAQYYLPSQSSPIAMQNAQMSSSTLKGRPVSSIDEVRAAQIDFDGSLFVFPDIANKKIYTKQINIDGTASLNMYELKPVPQEVPYNNNYVTKEELETVIAQLKESFNAAAAVTPQPTPKSSEVAKPASPTPAINF